MLELAKQHWPEYLIEAWCLATFMVSACAFGVLLFHPASPIAGFGFARDIAMGVAMGSTAIAIFRSPWGQRSGAHFNPAVTLTFYRLGKISGVDTVGYVAGHFAGGVAGVLIAWAILGDMLAASSVNFVATVPGKDGPAVAFAAEAVISFGMMSMVLFTSNAPRWSRLTPYFAGALVAAFIALEAPLSGMSMNPARTFASAAIGGKWTSWWIYFTAPTLAMLAAAEVFVRVRGLRSVLCAKFDHTGLARCIFDCRVDELEASQSRRAESDYVCRSTAV